MQAEGKHGWKWFTVKRDASQLQNWLSTSRDWQHKTYVRSAITADKLLSSRLLPRTLSSSIATYASFEDITMKMYWKNGRRLAMRERNNNELPKQPGQTAITTGLRTRVYTGGQSATVFVTSLSTSEVCWRINYDNCEPFHWFRAGDSGSIVSVTLYAIQTCGTCQVSRLQTRADDRSKTG